MVQAAKDRRFGDVSERLVTDWASLGLIDHPERTDRPTGKKGRGAYYTWSDNQRDLFLSLLERRGDNRQVAALALVPVGIWIYWGDPWIPLSQVRLALKTWCGEALKSSIAKREKDALVILNNVAGRQGSRADRAALKSFIKEALSQKKFDVDKASPLIRAVTGGGTQESSFGPFQFTSQELSEAMGAMLLAYDNYDNLSDGDFLEARSRQRMSVLQYVNDFEGLAAEPVHGHTFEPPSIEFFIRQSCRDLLLHLGMGVQARLNGRVLPAPLVFDWKTLPDQLRALPISVPKSP